MEHVTSIRDLLRPIQRELDSRVKIREKWIRTGFTVVPNALLLDKRVSAQAKAIFAVLCLHAFNKEEARLSYEMLQEEIGLSRPQVARYLRELKGIGIIVVSRTGRANRYEIVFSELENRVAAVIDHVKQVQERIAKRQEAEE